METIDRLDQTAQAVARDLAPVLVPILKNSKVKPLIVVLQAMWVGMLLCLMILGFFKFLKWLLPAWLFGMYGVLLFVSWMIIAVCFRDEVKKFGDNAQLFIAKVTQYTHQEMHRLDTAK